MRQYKKGFTLIEMLVVIAIISVLSMGISMLNMKDSSHSAYSAQQSLITAFYEARVAAMQKQTDVRVIIYRGKDITRRLRQVGVVYRAKGRDDMDLGWIALNDGFIMPQNVFFVPPENDFEKYVKLGKGIENSEVYKSTFNNGYTGAYEVVDIQTFPSRQPEALTDGSGDWYSYMFTSDGLSQNPGAYVMLAMGRMDSKGTYVVDNPFAQVGFVIRRIGHTIPFSGYDEMEETIK
jgi:prepilin-type N-terminal cleavage/methylation domain-containing protein